MENLDDYFKEGIYVIKDNIVKDSINELHEWIRSNLNIINEDDVKAIGFAIVNSRKKSKKKKESKGYSKKKPKEETWQSSWESLGEEMDRLRIARIQYREYKKAQEATLQRNLYAPYRSDLTKLNFTVKDVTYTYDSIDLTEFKRVTYDFEQKDFTVLEGPITRSGPFPYKLGGYKVTLYKQWDNLKEQFSKVDYLPLIGSKDMGAHYAETLGFAYNFRFDDEKERVYADIVTLEDMSKLSDHYVPTMEGWEVSIGFKDHRLGQKQLIDKLDHLAVSLKNKEMGRCRAGGDPCYINYKDQNLTEVVSHTRN